MVSKLEVRCRGPELWHVAGNTILRGDFAGHSQTLGSRFSFHSGRLVFARMTGEALLIVRSRVLAERLVRIVTGGAGYAAIIRVTLAVKDAVGLKADIVNLHAAQQTELIAAAMAGGAKFLSQFITAEVGRVEDYAPSGLTLPDCVDMCRSRTVAAFTMDAGSHLLKTDFSGPDTARRMTSETIPGLSLSQAAAQSFLQRFRNAPWCANGKVESADLSVVTHQAFIIGAVIMKQVRLPGLTLPKGIKNRQAEGVLSIRHGINTLLALALDFITVRTAAKGHPAIFIEHFRVAHRFHRHAHTGQGLGHRQFLMTLGAGFIADELGIYRNSSGMPALAATGLVEYAESQSKDQQAKNDNYRTQRVLPNIMTIHNSWFEMWLRLRRRFVELDIRVLA